MQPLHQATLTQPLQCDLQRLSWGAKHNRTTCNGVGNCSSKTGSRRQSDKKTILKHFLKGILKGKLLAPKLRKSADKSLSQPWCSRSNTIYDLQLQKTIVLRMQPLHQATLTQPLQCDLQRLSCKTQLELRAMASEIAAPKTGSRRQSDKKTILKHFLKGIFKGKLLAPKLRKSADNSLSQPWCSHSNTIYDLQLQKTIVLRMQPQHRATLTQPLQCVSQHPVANLHLSTDVATSNDDNEAAIPMQSATRDSRTAWNYAHRHNHSLQNT